MRGLAQELVNRLLAAGGACACTSHGNFGELRPDECPYAVSFDPEILKRVALELLEEAGVSLMLHTLFCDAPSTDRLVDVVIVENKSGRQALRGKIYIDATGDGDLAARAGARCEKAAAEGGRMMPFSLMCRVTGLPRPEENEPGLWINGVTTKWGPGADRSDGTDADDLTTAEIQARHELSKHLEELRKEHPDVQLVESAAVIGVRETRRIVGLYTTTEEDCLSGKPQADSIAVSSNPIPGYYGHRYFFDHLGFEIPYRSLVPADLDNVLLAGCCISACQPAFQSARSMAPNMAISQAAGTAAAMCVSRNCMPAELDVTALQAKLEQDGAVVRVPRSE